MVFTVHIALDAPPAGEGRPAEPIGSFGGFHQKLVPSNLASHLGAEFHQ